MGNSNGNADKKIYENRPKWENKGKRLEPVYTKKGNTRKNNNITWGNKPESTVKRRKIKEISTKVKQYKQNRTLQINEQQLSTNELEEMKRKHANNRVQEKPNRFRLEYGN